MDKKLIRKANLQLLIDRQYGIGKHGAKAEFARRMGKQPDYISRCLYPPGKPGAKNVGEVFARAVEKEFELDEYAFDKPGLGGADVIDVEGLPAALAQKIKNYRSTISVERLDIAASMGPGTEPPEMNMVVEHMRLDANWVRQNLVYTSTDNLRLISGRGDSMAPTIRNGDALLVDSGVTSVESDAIYFFLMRGQHHVKRIQRNLDGLTIISDNGQYREIDVPGDREGDIQVLAQIIYWWTGRSF
ncbi:S24 family peptidase [Pseudomonas proteolytica]|uniref:S24 family peptidase n=1 Tax=Pseudomonas proteolytica TaxID=219574 RepID=UPI00089D592E|nr:S24 family peptidase [Pseudomonas proteolytica]SEE79606.1 Phage repressor protein C, contains Cro/C1-type HTH and peptisase s24 domains [Pseudomonas proteolytica]